MGPWFPTFSSCKWIKVIKPIQTCAYMWSVQRPRPFWAPRYFWFSANSLQPSWCSTVLNITMQFTRVGLKTIKFEDDLPGWESSKTAPKYLAESSGKPPSTLESCKHSKGLRVLSAGFFQNKTLDINLTPFFICVSIECGRCRGYRKSKFIACAQ